MTKHSEPLWDVRILFCKSSKIPGSSVNKKWVKISAMNTVISCILWISKYEFSPSTPRQNWYQHKQIDESKKSDHNQNQERKNWLQGSFFILTTLEHHTLPLALICKNTMSHLTDLTEHYLRYLDGSLLLPQDKDEVCCAFLWRRPWLSSLAAFEVF